MSLADMSCYEDSDYINELDASHDNVQTDYFVNGVVESLPDNSREDRQWKWRYCRHSAASTAMTSSFQMPQTTLDQDWRRNCTSMVAQSAFIGAVTVPDNSREDREWSIHCGVLDESNYYLDIDNCYDTGYQNNYDATFSFECTDNGLVSGIYTLNDNTKEDRKFGFICCNLYIINPPVPSFSPTQPPSDNPTLYPSKSLTLYPSDHPTLKPSQTPTLYPSDNPTRNPSRNPTLNPTFDPLLSPSRNPTVEPTIQPSLHPSIANSNTPSSVPSNTPSSAPSTPPPSVPGTLSCGDIITGPYADVAIEFKVRLRFEGHLTLDASQSDFAVSSLSAKPFGGQVLAFDLDDDGVLTLSDITVAGDYVFTLEASSGVTGVYTVSVTCVSEAPSPMPTPSPSFVDDGDAGVGSIASNQGGKDEDGGVGSIAVIVVSAFAGIVVLCVVVFYVYRRRRIGESQTIDSEHPEGIVPGACAVAVAGAGEGVEATGSDIEVAMTLVDQTEPGKEKNVCVKEDQGDAEGKTDGGDGDNNDGEFDRERRSTAFIQ